jgi:hypothetical protein
MPCRYICCSEWAPVCLRLGWLAPGEVGARLLYVTKARDVGVLNIRHQGWEGFLSVALRNYGQSLMRFVTTESGDVKY